MVEYIEWLIIALLVIPALGLIGASFHALIMKDIPIIYLKVLKILGLTLTLLLSILISIELNNGTVIKDLVIGGIAINGVAATLLLLFMVIFLVAGLFSLYYTSNDRFALFTTMIFTLQLGMILVLITYNMFVLFIMWELMVISGYVLVAFNRTEESFEASIKYLIISSVGSLFLLLGLGLLSGVVPSLNFADIASATGILDTMVGQLAVIFMLIGFGMTGGIVVFNQWLPDAHPAAPAPVSALLSGLVVKAGIYGIYRTMSLIIPDAVASNDGKILIVLGLLTMTEGNLMVLAQLQRKDIIDIKRILAYSTTVHLGYLLLIAGINTDFAVVALLYHTINHALAKSLLFLMAGYFLHSYQTRDVTNLIGIGRHDKIIGTTMFVGFMSLGGLPLTGGFISKLLILIGIYQAGSDPLLDWALIIAVINSALAFGGYLWILKKLVFDKPIDKLEENFVARKGDLYIKILFGVMALFILILGIFPQLILDPIINLLG